MFAFKEMNKLNRHPAFRVYRQQNVRRLLLLLTILGGTLIMAWAFFDSVFFPANKEVLLRFRLLAIGLYIINLILALNITSHHKLCFHLIFLFYVGAIFSTFASFYTGGVGSDYTIGLSLILIAWLILVPLSYTSILVHAAVLILQYYLILLWLDPVNFDYNKAAETVFVFSGILITGMIAALNNNEAAMRIFQDRDTIENSLQTQKKINNELTQEIKLRRKLERELNLFSFAIDQVPANIIVMDHDRRIQYVNSHFTVSTGLGPAEVVGKSIVDVDQAFADEDVRNSIWKTVNRNQIWRGELKKRAFGGNIIWEDVVIAPFLDEAGKNKGYISLQDDISQRKEIERALKESEEKYRMLITEARDGIIITQNGDFIYVNTAFCKMMEYQEEEVLGQPFLNFVVEEDRQQLKELHEKRMAGADFPMKYAIRGITKSGKTKYFELNSTTIQMNGGPAGFIITRDVTEHRNALEALMASERKYRELADLLPQTIYEIDTAGNLVFLNKSGLDLFGLSLSEIRSELSVLKLLNKEDHQSFTAAYKKALESGSAVHSEYNVINAAGDLIPVINYSSPIARNQKMVGIRGILVDISERKKMEESLRLSEEKFRTLIQSLQEGLFVIQDGKFVYLNEAVVALIGYRQDELTGKEIFTVIPPEVRGEVADNYAKRIAGHPVQNTYESLLLHKDGVTRIPIILSLSLTSFENKPAVVGTAKDITDRKMAEAAIRESEEKFRTLSASALDSIVMFNSNLEVTFWNDASKKIFGYTESEAASLKLDTLIRLSSDQNIFDTKHQTAHAMEAEGRDKNGRPFPCEISTATFTLRGKKYGVGIIRDITERKQTEKELLFAKENLQSLNAELEQRVQESTEKLTRANTQLLNLQKENLQSQFEMLKSQVNPHFLFNSLNVLISLIKLEPDTAERFTEQLSKVYRYVLENKEKDLIPLATELDFLGSYLFLLNIRFGEKLRIEIHVEPQKTDQLLLPLSMQLLIENAIKHNTFSRRKPLVINIFTQENMLIVSNNLQVRETHYTSTGIGLRNIKNRYEIISELKPVFENTGTHFFARLPLMDA